MGSFETVLKILLSSRGVGLIYVIILVVLLHFVKFYEETNKSIEEYIVIGLTIAMATTILKIGFTRYEYSNESDLGKKKSFKRSLIQYWLFFILLTIALLGYLSSEYNFTDDTPPPAEGSGEVVLEIDDSEDEIAIIPENGGETSYEISSFKKTEINSITEKKIELNFKPITNLNIGKIEYNYLFNISLPNSNNLDSLKNLYEQNKTRHFVENILLNGLNDLVDRVINNVYPRTPNRIWKNDLNRIISNLIHIDYKQKALEEILAKFKKRRFRDKKLDNFLSKISKNFPKKDMRPRKLRCSIRKTQKLQAKALKYLRGRYKYKLRKGVVYENRQLENEILPAIERIMATNNPTLIEDEGFLAYHADSDNSESQKEEEDKDKDQNQNQNQNQNNGRKNNDDDSKENRNEEDYSDLGNENGNNQSEWFEIEDPNIEGSSRNDKSSGSMKVKLKGPPKIRGTKSYNPSKNRITRTEQKRQIKLENKKKRAKDKRFQDCVCTTLKGKIAENQITKNSEWYFSDNKEIILKFQRGTCFTNILNFASNGKDRKLLEYDFCLKDKRKTIGGRTIDVNPYMFLAEKYPIDLYDEPRIREVRILLEKDENLKEIKVEYPEKNEMVFHRKN